MYNTNDNDTSHMTLLVINIILSSICAFFVIWILANNGLKENGAIGALIFGILAPILSWQYYLDNKKTTNYTNKTPYSSVDSYNVQKKDYHIQQNNNISKSSSIENPTLDELIQEFQNYISSNMHDEALTIVNKIISQFPDYGMAYADRALVNYLKLLKNTSDYNRNEWNPIIEDYKKAFSLEPNRENVQMALVTPILGAQYINDFSNDSDIEFILDHDILFKNFPENTIAICFYTKDENDASNLDTLIKNITNTINHDKENRGSYLYALRAGYYTLLDVIKYSNNIKNDLEKAIEIDGDNLFNRFVRCFYMTNWLPKIIGEDSFDFDNNKLPNIDIKLINDTKQDSTIFANSESELLQKLSNGINIFYSLFSSKYAGAVFDNTSTVFELINIVKGSNFSTEEFISVLQNANLNYGKYESLSTQIKIIQKCKEYANIAYAFNEDNQSACLAQGIVKALYGDKDSAISICHKAINKDPENIFAYKMTGLVYIFIDKYDDALNFLNQALTKNPSVEDKESIIKIIELIEKIKQYSLQSQSNYVPNTGNKKGRELDI